MLKRSVAERCLTYVVALAMSSLAAWVVLKLLYREREFQGLFAFRHGCWIGAFVLFFIFAFEILLLKRPLKNKQLLIVSTSVTAAIYFVWLVMLMA